MGGGTVWTHIYLLHHSLSVANLDVVRCAAGGYLRVFPGESDCKRHCGLGSSDNMSDDDTLFKLPDQGQPRTLGPLRPTVPKVPKAKAIVSPTKV